VVLVALVAVGDLLVVVVRIRSTRHGMAWADAAVLADLAMMPAPWVVLATAAGVTVAEALRRRPPLKFVFSVGKEAANAFAGGLILFGLGYTGTADWAGIGSLTLAFLVITFIDHLLTVPVIAVASRTNVADRLRMNWDIRLVANAGRLVVA